MHSLMAIFREISTEMKDTEIDNLQEKFTEVNSKIQKHNEEINRKGRASIPNDTYMDLHKIEVEIRKVLKSSGLQMKMKQDAGSAIED